MSKLYRDYGLSLLLFLASGLMAIVLLLEWVHFRGERADLESRLAAKVEVNLGAIEAKEGTYAVPEIEEYAEMINRPLFVEGRRPPEAEETAGAGSLEQTPLTLKLMGVVFTPNDKTALLVDAQGKYKRARKNAVVGGWKLVGIEQDKVVLMQGEEQKELKLLKPKPKTAAPAPAGKAPVKKPNNVGEAGTPDESDTSDQSENSADENPPSDETTDEEQ